MYKVQTIELIMKYALFTSLFLISSLMLANYFDYHQELYINSPVDAISGEDNSSFPIPASQITGCDVSTHSACDYLSIYTKENQKVCIRLGNGTQSFQVPFETPFVRLEVNICCRNKYVTLNGRLTRTLNYTLGLGINYVDIGILSSIQNSKLHTNHSDHSLILIERRGRVCEKEISTPVVPCYLYQNCKLKLFEDLPCGLSDIKSSFSQAAGYWQISCITCANDSSCNWDDAIWIDEGNKQLEKETTRHNLVSCLAHKKLMFLGDSTNRGIMQSLIEYVNGTLSFAVKSHDFLNYHNVGQNTTFSFLYYPAFWLKKPTLFVHALNDLAEKGLMRAGQKDVYLIVGGVQWQTVSQLRDISYFIRRYDIPPDHVIIKTLSSGFHYPVPDTPYVHTQDSLKRLLMRNAALKKEASLRGFRWFDTLQITLSRYDEFLQGRCACHFHEVEENHRSFDATQMSLVRSRLSKLGLVAAQTHTESRYHISGPIHTEYTKMLVNRLCTKPL